MNDATPISGLPTAALPGAGAGAAHRLAPPSPGRRLRVVIDTDAANEIDDPFTIAWALARPDRLVVEAVLAAPHSFAHRRGELLRARLARDHPQRATPRDHELLAHHAQQLAWVENKGWDLASLDLPIFDPPGIGMARGFDEIGRVFDAMGIEPGDRIRRGSESYLPSADNPVDSDAARHLIALAMKGNVDGHANAAAPVIAAGDAQVAARASTADAAPLYVVALGCLTNIASALLIEPRIAERIVLVWTAGFPSHAPHPNIAFNLDQDVLATQVVFDSEVPIVYLPGYHVGIQLRLSRLELDAALGAPPLAERPIAPYLRQLWRRNPLADWLGLGPDGAQTWVLWDLITIAWLLDPDWVPSVLTSTPRLGDDLRWRADPTRRPMREAWDLHRDAVYADLWASLARASGAGPA